MGNRQGMVFFFFFFKWQEMVLSPGYFRFLVFYFFINLLLFTLCSLSSCFMFIGWLLIEASEEGWVLVYGWLCPCI